MTMIYSNPARENEAGALPDVEVFYDDADIVNGHARNFDANGDPVEPGWYWWACFPGCLPDSEPNGPFDTEAEAIADAQSEAAGVPSDDELPPCVLAMRCYCAGHARGNAASVPCDTNERPNTPCTHHGAPRPKCHETGCVYCGTNESVEVRS